MKLLVFRWKNKGPVDDPSQRIFSSGSDGRTDADFSPRESIVFTPGELQALNLLVLTTSDISFVSGNVTSEPPLFFSTSPKDTFVYGFGTDENAPPIYFSTSPRDTFATSLSSNSPRVVFSAMPGVVKGVALPGSPMATPPIRYFVERPLATKSTFMWGPELATPDVTFNSVGSGVPEWLAGVPALGIDKTAISGSDRVGNTLTNTAMTVVGDDLKFTAANSSRIALTIPTALQSFGSSDYTVDTVLTPNGADQTIVDFGGLTSSTAPSIWLKTTPSGNQFNFLVGSGTSGLNYSSNVNFGSYVDGQQVRVTIVRVGATLSFYINGSLVQTAAASDPKNITGSIRIGYSVPVTNGTVSLKYNGTINYLAVYKSARIPT